MVSDPTMGEAVHSVSPLVVLSGLYTAQSIPIFLVGVALPPILRADGVDLASIGSLGLLLVPWALKFLWAPFVDRHGSRRRCILGAQSMMVTTLIALSQVDPASEFRTFFAFLMLMAIASATQDIATDGYAVEHLPPGRQPAGSAIQAGAGALGMLFGGTLTLVLHEAMGWEVAVLVAAALSALATLPAIFADEKLHRRSGVPGRRRPSIWVFLKRHESQAILLLAVLFRLPDGLVKAVEQAFLVDARFTLTEIGLISGGSSVILGLVAAAGSMMAIRRIGLVRFLWATILLRSFCFAAYAATAAGLLPDAVLVGCAAALAGSRYVELVGLYVAFMRVASLAQAATDFTVPSSAAALAYAVGTLVGGVSASALGYPALFVAATALSLGLGMAAIRLAHRRANLDEGCSSEVPKVA